MYHQQILKKTSYSPPSTPINKKTIPTPSYGSLSGTIQRATANPESLSRDEWRRLDGAIGTRASNEIKSGKRTSWVPEFKGISSQLWGDSGGNETPIQAKLTIGAVGDKYEQEADRVAAEVVQQISRPAPVSSEVVQGKESKEEEGELQLKPMVQRRADAGGEASPDLASAINSDLGGGQPLDAGLQQSMGQAMGADFSGVRVHSDAQSDQLNQSIQAKAFTMGQDVFFRKGAYEPGSRGGQELIAHELTHVVQQNGEAVMRSHNDVGVSNSLSQLDKNSHHQKDLSLNVNRSSLFRLKDISTPSNTVQRYFDKHYSSKGTKGKWRQSDDMTMAVKTGYPNHELYAKAGKVGESNNKLQAVNAGVELIETAKEEKFSKGWWPRKQTAKLKKVEAKNKQNGTQGDTMKLYADCGKSNAVVVGGKNRQAVYDKPGGASKTKVSGSPTKMKIAIAKAWLEHNETNTDPLKGISFSSALISAQLIESELAPIVTAYANATTPEEKKIKKAEYGKKLNKVAEKYWEYYNTKLTNTERDNVDKALKINRYATPDVGQGYTISSGGPSAGKATWNFHWGGVVMNSDNEKDKVVLENYAVGKPDEENQLWTFDMYGTEKKGQTFHERHTDTQQHGKTPTTMTIEKEP